MCLPDQLLQSLQNTFIYNDKGSRPGVRRPHLATKCLRALAHLFASRNLSASVGWKEKYLPEASHRGSRRMCMKRVHQGYTYRRLNHINSWVPACVKEYGGQPSCQVAVLWDPFALPELDFFQQCNHRIGPGDLKGLSETPPSAIP